MTSLEGINGPLIQTLLRGKNDSKQSDEIQVSKYALLTKCEVKMAGYWLSSLFVEGNIGGYPILQYRTKKWQIPKYRVENRLNTDTVYFNHLFNRFRILIVAFF